jgi:thiamine kinase-like enzyme
VSAPRSCAADAASALDPAAWDLSELDAVLDRFPDLAGSPRHVEVVSGGLTNRIYKVLTPTGRQVVARFSSARTALLAIDRDAEFRNASAAARAGVGPRVVDYLPDVGVLVVEWIESRTFSPDDLDDSRNLARVAEACARLHSGPRFGNDFDMFAVQRRYLDLVRRRGFRLPSRYLDFLPQVERIRAALAVRTEPLVPCHNDLLAANILDDGARLWFIDFEYAGNNEACFELGNIWSESTLGEHRLDELLTAYYGHSSPSLLARARLFALMSKYGWTLWASIQSAVGEVDFDFWSWGMEKYERAVEEFDNPQFTQWISDVQQAN